MERLEGRCGADGSGTVTRHSNVQLALGIGEARQLEPTVPLAAEDVARPPKAGIDAVSAASRCNGSANGEPGAFRVNPIQATFRGGAKEPLQDWYPYLEGYSPDFVKSVLHAFASTARSVLDPFAGTGTTPVTAALQGRRGLYCELNPLLQFLVETKSAVLAQSAGERLQLRSRLTDLADELPISLAELAPDQALADTYTATFGRSAFFASEAFESCLKLRSWLDLLQRQSPSVAALATVAVLRSLVPCSNMIRRGDLRFRTEAEHTPARPPLASEVAGRMRTMAQHVSQLPMLSTPPLMVAADAKRLDRVAPLGVDAIVTSPPYLNGTNYYRNTKIELWFLRKLESTTDLTAFRRATVTAGINDVVGERRPAPASETIRSLVQRLENDAYDPRIAMMVSRYFSDMRQVLRGISRHAKPSATLAMDIGDSAYAGVHVDTPKLLAELLYMEGWTGVQEVLLRGRLSRGGQRLRQVLMTARAPSRRRAAQAPTAQAWRARWMAFKTDLPHQKGEFRKRNWGSALHSLCSYQGKLKPSLAYHMVKTFARPGGRLLDPFGGVGTIAFEAALNGVQAWSFDISPPAIAIAKAKLEPAAPSACLNVVEKLDDFIRTQRPVAADRECAASIRFNGALSDYYHPDTFDEILLARRYFQENPPADEAGALVFSCLLHVLHGNRPYALSRRSHPITPFAPSGEAHYKSLTDKLRAKLTRALATRRPRGFAPGLSLAQDATEAWPRQVDDLDVVVTSPPFYDSTRFYSANWIRLWFAGWNEADFRERRRSFLDERQKRSFAVYEPVIRQARERLKPGGVCVFHLGKSRKCDMATEVARVAGPWFAHADVFAESVAHCESHGIRDKGTVVEHTYLVLH